MAGYPPLSRPSPGFLHPTVEPWGILTAAGCVAAAATLLGFLGGISWFLDLFSHFRVQYALGLTLFSSLLLLGRRRRQAAIFMAFACVNLPAILPLYAGAADAPPADGTALRAVLLNVSTRRGDAELVGRFLRGVDADIVILEEISPAWVRALPWLLASHPHHLLVPREDNFGIGFLSRLPLARIEAREIGDAEVPSILATVRTPRGLLRVVATHPPPPAGGEYSGWRNGQLAALVEHTRSPLPLILIGDLNTTPWNRYFRRLLDASGLRDSTRGFGLQPTWPNFIFPLRIPLDHCLHSPDITVVDRRLGPNVGSDHYPLIVDLVVPGSPTAGRGGRRTGTPAP